MKHQVYIILDTSASMLGEPMQSMRNGVDGLLSALRANPDTAEGTVVTAIAFSSHARVIAETVPLEDFILPDLEPGGSTNVGEAISLLLDTAKNACDGGQPPMSFFFLDGYPTDDHPDAAIAAFRSGTWGKCAAFAVAGGSEKHFLARLAGASKVFDLCVNPNFSRAIQD